MTDTIAPQLYLIPCFLDEPDPTTLPSSIIDAVKKCSAFYVENERSARRFLKILWKEMEIDNYEWYTIHKAEDELKNKFKSSMAKGKVVGIISEAGCPGIADPGQTLIALAQHMGIVVKPLVGPNSVTLALMASGLNGQQFRFNGYLPIESGPRLKAIKELENSSGSGNCTEIFIETPYRNRPLVESILQNCKHETRLCIAVNLTGPAEFIQTKTIKEWKEGLPEMHKRPAIFLLYAGK